MKEMVFLHQKMYLTTYLVSLGTLFGKTYHEEYVTEGGGGGAGVLSYICCEGYGLQEV